LKNVLLPQLDLGLAALMDDLATSGLLEQTLVIVMGEFGRTPKVSFLPGETKPGRDHWAHAYSGLFAGQAFEVGRSLVRRRPRGVSCLKSLVSSGSLHDNLQRPGR